MVRVCVGRVCVRHDLHPEIMFVSFFSAPFLFFAPISALPPFAPPNFFPVGGPISQLEARTMATMRAEIIADLRPKGYTPAVSTQLVSFERFKQAFGGDGSVSGSGPPSAAERLGQPSAEDRKKEAVAEEEVRIHRQTLAAATKAGWRLQLNGNAIHVWVHEQTGRTQAHMPSLAQLKAEAEAAAAAAAAAAVVVLLVVLVLVLVVAVVVVVVVN